MSTDMSQRVEDLRDFEREYRTRMRLYLEDALATVSAPDAAAPLRAAIRRVAEAPDVNLREILAELPEAQRQRLLTALLRVPAVTQ